jgi:hypothetical protein
MPFKSVATSVLLKFMPFPDPFPHGHERSQSFPISCQGLEAIQKLAQDAGKILRLFPGGIVSCFRDYSHLAACDVLVH